MNNADAILLSICKEAAAANLSETQKSAFLMALNEVAVKSSSVDGLFLDCWVNFPESTRRDTEAAICDRVSDSIVSRYFDHNGDFIGYQWGPLVESYAWAKHNKA